MTEDTDCDKKASEPLYKTPKSIQETIEIEALLKQANTDSSKMAEVIGVSEAQLRFVTNTASGMGLIKDCRRFGCYSF